MKQCPVCGNRTMTVRKVADNWERNECSTCLFVNDIRGPVTGFQAGLGRVKKGKCPKGTCPNAEDFLIIGHEEPQNALGGGSTNYRCTTCGTAFMVDYAPVQVTILRGE